MLTDLTAIVPFTPLLGIFQSTSRLLLTIGVGLFLAYILLIIGANMAGFLHRQVVTLIRRQRGRALSRPDEAPSHRVQRPDVPRALE